VAASDGFLDDHNSKQTPTKVLQAAEFSLPNPWQLFLRLTLSRT
jgi:hypothetical protein